MGEKRPTLRLIRLRAQHDQLVEQLRVEENAGWHHLPGGDARYQTHLRTSTWITETEQCIKAEEEKGCLEH